MDQNTKENITQDVVNKSIRDNDVIAVKSLVPTILPSALKVAV